VSGRVTSDPPTVEVIGPESRIRELSGATTEPVSIAGARESVHDRVTVGVPDSAVRLLQAQTASVAVEILPAPVELVVNDVPVRWRNLASGLGARIKPTATSVTVRGRREAVSSITADTIQAYVDLAGLGPGRYNLRIQVEPSNSFGVAEVEPVTVSVTIR